LLAHYQEAHTNQTALDVATAMKPQARELERRFIALTETHDQLKETLARLETDIKGTYSNMRATISSMAAEWQERSEERRSVPEDIFHEVVNDYKVAVAVSLGKGTDRIAGLEKSLQVYWIYNVETLQNARQEYNAACIILNPAMTLDNPKLPRARRERLAEARKGGLVHQGLGYSMGMRAAVSGTLVVLPDITVSNHCMMVGSPFPEELSLKYQSLDILYSHRTDPRTIALLEKPVRASEDVPGLSRISAVGRLVIETPLADLCSSWNAGYHLPACMVQGNVFMTARTLLSMLVVNGTVYSRSNCIVDLVRTEELDAVGSVLIRGTFVRRLAKIVGGFVPEAEEVLPAMADVSHGGESDKKRQRPELGPESGLAREARRRRTRGEEGTLASSIDSTVPEATTDQRLASFSGAGMSADHAPYTSVLNCYFADGVFFDCAKKVEACYCAHAVLTGQVIVTHCIFDRLELRPEFHGLIFSSKINTLYIPDSIDDVSAFLFDCEVEAKCVRSSWANQGPASAPPRTWETGR